MGIQSKVTGTGNKSKSTEKLNHVGSHAISINKVLAATDNSVITPLSPGDFCSIRSKSVVTSPKYFTADEATALRNEAKDKEKGATATEKAYKALKRIENSDVRVHKAHRGYEKAIAKTELEKKQSDAGLAKKLHSLRASYTQIGASIERAETNADKRIVEIRAKIKEMV